MATEHADTVFVAVIGDIRGSRDLTDRGEAQREFKQVIDSLNDELPDSSIASQFTVTTGDEFQVLLREATDAVEAVVSVSDRFHPARLRFGIGVGTLETELNPNQAIGMDGPCFYRAREAIEAAEGAGAWVRVDGWSSEVVAHVNAMFDLVQCVREDWTERQAQFARALKAEGSQKRVVERFDVSKSTVSESLSAGHVQEVRNAERSLGERLQTALEEERA
jgi:hypothetical protein